MTRAFNSFGYLLSFLFISFSAISQSSQYNFRGGLIDEEGDEVPFAHFRMATNSSRGFVSNARGEFYFQIDDPNVNQIEVSVSAIGYTSGTFLLRANVFEKLKLAKSQIKLQEITILARDYEREFISKVIESIPKNYPTEEERIVGEIWEKAYGDSLYTLPYYKVNAQIAADKSSYATKAIFGNVQFLSGDLTNSDTVTNWGNIRIVAGVHNVHRFDFVMQRMGPLNKADLSSNQFDFVDTLYMDDRKIVMVQFVTKEYDGLLYVDTESFAVIKGEFQQHANKLGSVSTHRRIYLRFTTEYAIYQDKWRLSYINYKTGFREGDSNTKEFHLDNLFFLIKHEITDEPIKFNDKVDFMDRLTDKVALVPDSLAANNAVLKNIVSNRALRVFSKLYSTYSINISPIKISEYGVLIPQFQKDEVFTKNSQNVVTFFAEMGMELRNDLRIGWIAEARQNVWASNGLRLRLDRPLNFNGSMMYSLSVGSAYNQARHLIGSYTAVEAFEIKNKQFKGGETDVFVESRSIDVLTSASLLFRLSPRFHIHLQGMYHHPVWFENGVYFLQGSKRQYINEYVQSYYSDPIISRNLSYSLGIYMNF